MNYDKRKTARDIVEKGRYTIIWVGADMPCEFLDEKVELIYENMDGVICACDAIYTYDKNAFGHNPYFKRCSDGAHMVKCIAWKKRG